MTHHIVNYYLWIMNTKTITLKDLKRSLLNDLKDLFTGNEAYSITRLILEYFGYPEFDVLKNPTLTIDTKIHAEIKKIVSDLYKNKPIQYILGESIFFDLKLKVNENVLIPRPETEELVSKMLLDKNSSNPRIIDIGCGSGCISIALGKNIPGSTVYGIDVKPEIIELAKENARSHNVLIDFEKKNILKPESIPTTPAFDIIVSNPPYVTLNERHQMQANVLNYEPDLALFVPDDDPLIFYRNIIVFAKRGLRKNGVIWLEINEKFGQEIKDLYVNSGFGLVKIIKDIHNKDRFIKARFSNV